MTDAAQAPSRRLGWSLRFRLREPKAPAFAGALLFIVILAGRTGSGSGQKAAKHRDLPLRQRFLTLDGMSTYLREVHSRTDGIAPLLHLWITRAVATSGPLGVDRMTTDLLGQLADGPLHRFADWPNPDVSNWGAGVYTVWDDDGALVYVGTAGRGLTAAAHRSGAAFASKRRKGLRDRLGSHASARLARDQFSIYVFDRLVLPALSAEQVEAVAAGELVADALARRYIHDHLAYRFIITGDAEAARAVEWEVEQGAISGRRPLLNPCSYHSR